MMTKANVVRCVVDNGKTWFPIVDIVRDIRQGSGLKRPANTWFKNNIPEGSVRRLKLPTKGKLKGGNLLCVDAESVRIVGMYEAHIAGGKDFRAKWADLPDTPKFDTDVKRELSWKNLYKWSKAEHQINSGLSASEVSKVRRVAFEVGYKTGNESINEVISYIDALTLLRCENEK